MRTMMASGDQVEFRTETGKSAKLEGSFFVRGRTKPAVALLAALLLLCISLGCSQRPAGLSVAAGDDRMAADCLDAAKHALGTGAEIAKCGHLVGGLSVEAVAFIRLERFKDNADGLPVKRLVILRTADSHWYTALDVAKEVQNPSGYIGIDYIDDSEQYPGFRAAFLDRRADGKVGFVLQLTYLRQDGTSEGLPMWIAWNPDVGRFQEFTVNEEPGGFVQEVKNPPHIRSAK